MPLSLLSSWSQSLTLIIFSLAPPFTEVISEPNFNFAYAAVAAPLEAELVVIAAHAALTDLD